MGVAENNEVLNIDIIDLVGELVYEKNSSLLNFKSDDSPFKLGNRLSLLFAVFQLVLVDISLFVTFTVSSTTNLAANAVFVFEFLLILTVVAVALLYGLTKYYGYRAGENNDSTWYQLKLNFCSYCQKNSFEEKWAILHEFENENHTVYSKNVRVRVDKLIRDTAYFRIYEMFLILISPLLAVIIGEKLHSMDIEVAGPFLYTLIPIVMGIRALLRYHSNSNIPFLVLRRDIYNTKLENVLYYYLTPHLITKRYLKEFNEVDFPILKTLGTKTIFLSDKVSPNNLGKITVSPYSGLNVGIYNLIDH